MKGPCLIVTQTPVTLSGEQTLQSVTTAESRVLVAGQADARENGIYVTSTGVWRRAKDFSRTVDVRKGTQIRVTDGTRPGIWTVTSENPIAFGTSDINFSVDEAIKGRVELVVDANAMMVMGQVVQIDDRTRFENGGPDDLGIDTQVDVTGVAAEDGALRATEVELVVD